jgi:hypothetical protein
LQQEKHTAVQDEDYDEAKRLKVKFKINPGWMECALDYLCVVFLRNTIDIILKVIGMYVPETLLIFFTMVKILDFSETEFDRKTQGDWRTD